MVVIAEAFTNGSQSDEWVLLRADLLVIGLLSHTWAVLLTSQMPLRATMYQRMEVTKKEFHRLSPSEPIADRHDDPIQALDAVLRASGDKNNMDTKLGSRNRFFTCSPSCGFSYKTPLTTASLTTTSFYLGQGLKQLLLQQLLLLLLLLMARAKTNSYTRAD